MNKNDRRQLNTAIRRFVGISAAVTSELLAVIASLKDNEEEKLENMPKSLANSPQAYNIENAIGSLESIEEYLSSVEDSYNAVANEAGIDIPSGTVLPEIGRMDDGPRNNRFQILISDQTLQLLKLRTAFLGISCNEFICHCIHNELFKDPYQ